MCNDIDHARTCEKSAHLMKFFELSGQLECFREYFNLYPHISAPAYLPATGKTLAFS